ncbi:hypothetical protein ACWC5C_42010 [Streptomyces sp. NPDC001700]
MTVGDKRLVTLTKGLVSDDPKKREDTCGTITDWVNSFDSREATLLAIILSSSVNLETEWTCRESQLHALVELSDTGLIHASSFSPLGLIDKTSLQGSEIEYIEHLLSMI